MKYWNGYLYKVEYANERASYIVKMFRRIWVFFCLFFSHSFWHNPPSCLNLLKAGMASAQDNMGVMFEQGKGPSKNYKDAYYWTYLAASENANFQELRDLIPQKLAGELLNDSDGRCCINAR